MPQTENLQKPLRGAVQQGPPQFVGPAHDPGQIALQKLPQQVAALDPTNGFDLAPFDRLAIGNDGQGFHGRRRKAGFDRRLQVAA